MFKSRGYATGAFGKWHLGHHPQFHPHRHGFDEFIGLPYSNDMWPKHPNSTYPPLPLFDGEVVIESDPDQRKLTRLYTERAVGFIEKHRDEPFFAYVAHAMPHVPLHVSEAFKGRTGLGMYADVIAEIDWSVGEILDTLERTGNAERTLVIFTSDNGPWLLYGDHAGSSGPLREGKGTTFEGGVRVPFIARLPGVIPADSTCTELAATIDLLPTFAALAGAEMPADRIIDGRSILPLLRAEAGAASPHDSYLDYYGQRLEAVRSGQWKLIFPHDYVKPAPPGGAGKPGEYARPRIELSLYDLKKDPQESSNVVAEHPEVVARLETIADRAREDLGDSLRKQQGRNVRPPGRISGAGTRTQKSG
jgi:arylsulfatase A-like enzyme